jgi:hypothetical protein
VPIVSVSAHDADTALANVLTVMCLNVSQTEVTPALGIPWAEKSDLDEAAYFVPLRPPKRSTCT